MEQPADVLATVSGGDIAIRVCREEWTDDGASGVTGSSAVLILSQEISVSDCNQV